MYDEDEEDEDEQQAKKDAVVETKKETKKKEKGLKSLFNDSNNTKKPTPSYKNKKSNENQTNQYKDNEYEPKKFYNSGNMNQKNFIIVVKII